MGALLNGAGELVTEDDRKAELLNAYLASVCSQKYPLTRQLATSPQATQGKGCRSGEVKNTPEIF